MTGANITLRDSGDGCIIKDTNLDAAQYVIFEETGQTRYNLTVLNGEYLIKNKGNAVVIAGRSEASTITVKGGFFKAISDEKMAIGIITMKLGNASFENCTLQGYSNAPMPLGAANSSNAGQAGMGGGMLLQSVSGKIRIKGGTFFGYSVCNRAYGIGITNVSTMIGKGEVEIDNGEFYGTTKTYSHASVEGCHIQNTKSSIIKGGKFSATGTGLNMKTTEQSTIIGGYFEGSEKGVWIGRGKCLLKNATAKEASATSLAVNQYAETDNVATSYTIKADLMIGYSGYDVEAYVDNCSLSGTIDNVTVQNQNSGSTKTSAKLYISNTACNKIFIIDKGGNDGENMVFVGKNVSYNGYEGSNLIDTTTYANQVFCEDI